MRFKKILAPAMLILFSGALLVQLPIAIADRTSNYDLFDPIIDVRYLLVEGFVDQTKLDDSKMQLAMINSMIETLDDPHTVFVAPDEYAEFEKDIRGSYVGIGCEVNIIDDYLTIISPMDGSPALEAGIMAGDVVLEIEGQSTFKMPIQDCIAKLMGEPGTPVTIKVRHLDGTEQPYTITRSRITTRTVRGLRRQGEHWNYCIDDKLGLSYIRVTQFNATTIDELTAALDECQQRGLNGLILDLRDNGGGEFEAAVEMTDLFLDQGTIVSVRPREGRGDVKTFGAQLAGTLPDFPMLVLANERSASASEIVAGALQENHRAKILGTRTFGKGSVQEIHELDYNRGTLKFTSAHYYLPSGRNIHRSSESPVWGVDPDPGMVLPVPDEDYIEMFRARREFEIIRNGKDNGPACADAQWIRDHLKDQQLARAVEALSTAVRGADWPQVTQEQSAVVAFDQELNRAIEQRTSLIEATSKVEERIAELQKLSTQVGKPPLLPPDIDLANGTLAVRDKQGNLVGTYRIDGGNVELALKSIKLTPVAGDN